LAEVSAFDFFGQTKRSALVPIALVALASAPLSAEWFHGGRRLPQPLGLGAFVCQPDLGDRPDIGLQVAPLLLAAQGEPTVVPSARGVP
jgi:hypothetical protein